MKKLISIFLSLVMALSVCSVAFVSNAQTIAQPLKYDYTLEKIAMQRACELVYLYEHKRPNGSSVFTAYSDYGYNSNGKGENIAQLLIKVKIQLIMPLLFTTLGVKIMNIMPVRVTDVQCLTLAIPQ